MIKQLHRWLPERALVIVADGSYAVVAFLAHMIRLPHVTLVTRMRLDAALYDPAPKREAGKRGRPAAKGKRQPTLAKRLTDPDTIWQTCTVSWYGGIRRSVEMATGTALWYPFHEVRTHLGIETQRQWSDLAILRTTPALLGLLSLSPFSLISCWVSNPFLFVRLLGIPKPCQLFRTRWPSFVCSCGPPAFLLGPLFITRSSQSHGLSLTILWIRSPLPRDLDKV